MFSNNASSYQNVASSHTIQSLYIMYKKEDYLISLLPYCFPNYVFHWLVWLLRIYYTSMWNKWLPCVLDINSEFRLLFTKILM